MSGPGHTAAGATPPFIDGPRMRALLSFPVLIDALAQAHRRAPMEVAESLLGTESAQYFVRHAADPGRHFLSKLITSIPANTAAGLPAVQALCVLFDAVNGNPLALLDGTELTCWRTAADSALGARLLAPPAPHTLLVAGAGRLAPWMVQAHRCVRPSIERVLVWNRTGAAAAALVRSLRAEGIDALQVHDLEQATRQAQVISTCTRAHEPIIRGAWLSPGTHLDLVGGYTPQTREADDEAIRRARVFTDLRASALAGVGDILQPLASGAMRPDDLLGDLYDLMAMRVPGRRDPADITLFKNAGGGHLDLMTAVLVLALEAPAARPPEIRRPPH